MGKPVQYIYSFDVNWCWWRMQRSHCDLDWRLRFLSENEPTLCCKYEVFLTRSSVRTRTCPCRKACSWFIEMSLFHHFQNLEGQRNRKFLGLKIGRLLTLKSMSTPRVCDVMDSPHESFPNSYSTSIEIFDGLHGKCFARQLKCQPILIGERRTKSYHFCKSFYAFDEIRESEVVGKSFCRLAFH